MRRLRSGPLRQHPAPLDPRRHPRGHPFSARILTREDHLALEATFHCWAIADILRPHVARLVVSNPLQTKAIAQAKIKTDKVDAKVLAHLLRCDYLPEVWQPDERTRTMRTVCGRRAGLISERTRLKNRIRGVLNARLIPAPDTDLFEAKGLRWLQELQIDPQGRALIDSDLRLLELLEREIEGVDDALAADAWEDPRVRLLMTIPGVDFPTAQTILAALGDIARFQDGDHAASYLGLVPSTSQSGDHCYHGPITKHGNPKARWMMVQAAQHLATHPGPVGVFFRRVAKRKNRNVAVVATARKLLVIAWLMLTAGEPYRYAQPEATQAKLARLRVRVTGKRRAGGTAKGRPRSPRYGTGQGVRSVPSLPQVYRREGLPAAALESLPAGERQTLAHTKTIAFARRVERPAQRSRTSTTAGSPTRLSGRACVMEAPRDRTNGQVPCNPAPAEPEPTVDARAKNATNPCAGA